jgi:hypothetical protein
MAALISNANAKTDGSLDGAIERRRLDQHHRVQTAGPYPVEPDPEQAVDREQLGPRTTLTTKDIQLMTEGEVLQFHYRPPPQSARHNRGDRTQGLIHTGDTTAANLKTLDYSPPSEFLVRATVHPVQVASLRVRARRCKQISKFRSLQTDRAFLMNAAISYRFMRSTLVAVLDAVRAVGIVIA